MYLTHHQTTQPSQSDYMGFTIIFIIILITLFVMPGLCTPPTTPSAAAAVVLVRHELSVRL